jgi:dTMP kinase
VSEEGAGMLARIPLFPHTYPGSLIAIEGLDGTGKTTLISLVQRALTDASVTVVVAKHPTNAIRQTDIFNKYQYEPERRSHIDYRALLATLLSDRFQHVFEVIRPALARGEVVIMDRYIHTLVVMMRARGYNESWIVDACSAFPKPDIAWLLDVPFPVAESRIRARRDAKDSYVEFGLFKRIQQHFRLIAEQGDLQLVNSETNTPEHLSQLLLRELSSIRVPISPAT